MASINPGDKLLVDGKPVGVVVSVLVERQLNGTEETRRKERTDPVYAAAEATMGREPTHYPVKSKDRPVQAWLAAAKASATWVDRTVPSYSNVAKSSSTLAQLLEKTIVERDTARKEEAASRRAVDALKEKLDAAESWRESWKVKELEKAVTDRWKLLTARTEDLANQLHACRQHYRDLQTSSLALLGDVAHERGLRRKAEDQLEHTCENFSHCTGPMLDKMEADLRERDREIERLRAQLAGTQAGVPFTRH